MKTKNIETFFDEVEELEIFDFEEIKERATKNNCTLSSVDIKIDDGCVEEGDDEYVMLCSFYVSDNNTGERNLMKVYYGDNTKEIGYIFVN